MAKNSITDYSKTASLNTDIQSVDIDEGCLPSGINNAIRELMADLAEMNDGTVSLTSPSFAAASLTGNLSFGDNDKAIFGAGNDLQIYHDGSHSIIQDAGTGDLILQGGNDLILRETDGTTEYLRANEGAGVQVFHNGSQKLLTTSTGIDVTGTVTADGLTVSSGSNQITLDTGDQTTYGTLDVGHFSNGAFIGTYAGTNAAANILRFGTSGAERMRITSGGEVQIGTSTSDTNKLFVYDSDASNSVIYVRQDGAGPIQSWHGSFGTERMRITSSGNVGIGTSSPVATLQIKTQTNGNAAFQNSTSVSGGVKINAFNDAANASVPFELDGSTLQFNISATEKMRIDSSGNVGIGDTAPVTPLTIATTNKLGSTFTGTTNGEGLTVTQTNYTAGNYISLVEAAYDDSNDANPNVRIGAMFDGNGSNLAFGTSNSYGSGITNTAMFIDSSGNVGIGTSSPQEELTVNSSGATAIALRSTSLTSDKKIVWEHSSETVERAFIGFNNNSGKMTYKAGASGWGGYMAFETGGSERMRIDSSGNVLIANTTNNINNGGIMLRATGDTYYGITSTGNTLHVYDNTNSVYRFYVNGNGGIRNYSANNVNLSDQREKKNITDAASTWTDIKNFSIKEFHYNSEDDADPKKIGVIAQDVQASNANLVSTFNVDEDTQRLAVKEQQITWMAIKALQEAITKIEDLETRVATLEGN